MVWKMNGNWSNIYMVLRTSEFEFCTISEKHLEVVDNVLHWQLMESNL